MSAGFARKGASMAILMPTRHWPINAHPVNRIMASLITNRVRDSVVTAWTDSLPSGYERSLWRTTTTNRCMSTKVSHSANLSQLVKELRNRTGAPMLECKKALTAEGVDEDIDKATDWLRKYGSAKAASKLAGRETKEGLVGLAIWPDASRASICQVACETDFSARSESFIHLVQNVVFSAMHSSQSTNLNMDVDALLLSPLHSSVPTHNRSLKELLDDTVLSIRENLHIVQACSIHSPSQQAVISGYIHGKLSANTGTCAALVTLIPSSTCTLSREAVLDVGKKLSMHVVAAKPMYLSPKDIPQHVLDRERDIILEQMNQTPSMTKKRDIMDKIILGKMNKFHEQVCLTEQAHMVEEGNPKVAKYLQGLGLNVVSFCALSVH